MRKLVVGATLAAALAAALPATLSAQMQPVTQGPGSFYLGPYVGYMIFGDLFETRDNVEYSNEDGAIYGAQAGFSISPNFSILGNFGYTKAPFTIENCTGCSQPVSGDMGIFLYDGAFQFRLPFGEQAGSWIAPFIQLGAGAIKWTPDTDDFNSRGDTKVQLNVGLGSDYQLSQMVGMRLLVRDYITSLNWSDDNTFAQDFNEGQTAHNFAITFGLNFGF